MPLVRGAGAEGGGRGEVGGVRLRRRREEGASGLQNNGGRRRHHHHHHQNNNRRRDSSLAILFIDPALSLRFLSITVASSVAFSALTLAPVVMMLWRIPWGVTFEQFWYSIAMPVPIFLAVVTNVAMQLLQAPFRILLTLQLVSAMQRSDSSTRQMRIALQEIVEGFIFRTNQGMGWLSYILVAYSLCSMIACAIRQSISAPWLPTAFYLTAVTILRSVAVAYAFWTNFRDVWSPTLAAVDTPRMTQDDIDALRTCTHSDAVAENAETPSACCICLNEFTPDDKVLVLPCSDLHVLHAGCGTQWFVRSPRCPLCNAECTRNQGSVHPR